MSLNCCMYAVSIGPSKYPISLGQGDDVGTTVYVYIELACVIDRPSPRHQSSLSYSGIIGPGKKRYEVLPFP